ncbi:MAG: hypothetical protein E4H13_05190 [Calditrichales bacterium]|nr:MAG: hypothetical protein E4H13_05190 [Calditrichales bacterium]
MIGITPDYIIEIREDILDKDDGPMLTHGLKELHQSKIILPTSKEVYPKKEFLEWRFNRFKSTG